MFLWSLINNTVDFRHEKSKHLQLRGTCIFVQTKIACFVLLMHFIHNNVHHHHGSQLQLRSVLLHPSFLFTFPLTLSSSLLEKLISHVTIIIDYVQLYQYTKEEFFFCASLSRKGGKYQKKTKQTNKTQIMLIDASSLTCGTTSKSDKSRRHLLD